MRSFKAHTVKEILKYLQENNAKSILDQLVFYKKAHKKNATYQLCQEVIQTKLIINNKMMLDRINYTHNNPVKMGYVDEAIYWRYSSAIDYEGVDGLIGVCRVW